MLKIGNNFLFNKLEILYISFGKTELDKCYGLIVHFKNGRDVFLKGYSLNDIEEVYV